MNYTDGKTLLNILKPKKDSPPSFGEIPFDTIIFDALKSEATGKTALPSSEPKV